MARTRPSPRRCHRPFSPHARGWPVTDLRDTGMHLGSPRTRGDGPESVYLPIQGLRRSPRTRGDGPPVVGKGTKQDVVLPARAGMARATIAPAMPAPRFSPHARGWPGEPLRRRGLGDGSPRTRGDGPDLRAGIVAEAIVLPARAGMARPKGSPPIMATRFSPHARGWPGSQSGNCCGSHVFSPHARGWPVPGLPRC